MFDDPYFTNVSHLKSSKPDVKLRNAVIKDTYQKKEYEVMMMGINRRVEKAWHNDAFLYER